MEHYQRSTQVKATTEQLWIHATTIEGISYELAPWLKMTLPRGLDPGAFAAQMGRGEVSLPAPLGRSWILLFGLLPFDWDDLTIAELEPGRRFLERSSTMSLRVWQHERIIEPSEEGARLTDRLSFEARAFLPVALARRAVKLIFDHRHTRLAAAFPRA